VFNVIFSFINSIMLYPTHMIDVRKNTEAHLHAIIFSVIR